MSPATLEITDTSTGTFNLGGRPVRRLGFGAMRITGDGVWGEPPDPAGVRELKAAICAKLKREPFSLMFTTTGNFVLPQRIYGFKHATLGAMSLFLVPIGREGDVTTYQSIFN